MAAVTTKKPGSDIGLQLTFPGVFQEVYADSGEGEAYLGGEMAPAKPFREGDDLQDAYHRQKCKDAHHMVMAAVNSKRAADARLLASHANYFGMPKPVLTQRHYANPSMGNQPGAIDSARRTAPGSSAPFHCVESAPSSGGMSCDSMRGGVIRTLKGQEWAAKKLQERVKQLDAIDAAAMSDALDSGQGLTYGQPGEEGEFPLRSQLDLAAAFGDLQSAMMAGNFASIMKYSIIDLGKLTRLLSRWSITATADDFREALENLDEILESILGRAAEEQAQFLEDPDPMDAPELDFVKVADLIAPRIQALRDYVKGMYDSVNLSAKDRKTLSRSLLKSTGLTRLSLNRFEGPKLEIYRAIQRYVDEREAAIGRQQALIEEEEEPEAAEGIADFLGRYGQIPPGRAAEAVERVEERARGPVMRFPEVPRLEVRNLADARALQIQAFNRGLPMARGFTPISALTAEDRKEDDDVFDMPARPMARAAPGGGFDRDNRAAFGARQGAYLGEAPPGVAEGAVVVNPMRRMAPAGLRPVAEAPEPVFRAPAAEAAMPAGALEGVRAARAQAEALAAQARAARADIERRRGGPGAGQQDIRQFFQGQGKKKAAAKGKGKGKGKAKGSGGKTAAEKAARVEQTRRAAIAQLIERHLKYGEELPEFARKAWDEHKAKLAELRAREASLGTAAGLEAEALRAWKDGRPTYAASLAAKAKEMREAEEEDEDEGTAGKAAAAAPARKAPGLATKGTSGTGKAPLGLTRKSLPKTREGYVELAAKLKGCGHNIRVNSGSQLKSIRANFIKRLGL